MVSRKQIIIFLGNDHITHLPMYDYPIEVGDNLFFDIGVGIMHIKGDIGFIKTDEEDLDDIEFPFEKIAYNNRNGDTVIVYGKSKEKKPKYVNLEDLDDIDKCGIKCDCQKEKSGYTTTVTW